MMGTFIRETFRVIVEDGMRKSPLAVVTMVFNEPDFLPLWVRYYNAQVGLKNCYIIDHGSTDLSTLDIAPFNVIRIPRSPLNEEARVFVSQFCNSLLTWFDAVAYTDVDEFLVADPARYADLCAYAKTAPHDVTTAFGMDVVQTEDDPSLDVRLPVIGHQRNYVRPFSSLCKPGLIRRPVWWTIGFHYADAPSRFDDLLMFHLAFADRDILHRRQRKRNATPRVGEGGAHHDIPPGVMAGKVMASYASLPRQESVDLSKTCVKRTAFEARLLCEGEAICRDTIAQELWRIPERFVGCL